MSIVRPLSFVWGSRTHVVGIVNATPDSFSGDGHATAAGAIAHGLRLVEEGADLLDVGGESTRPGAVPVAADEEIRRTLPVVVALAERAGVPISIDTSKSAVAAAALEAGACVVNDVWALARDPALAEVAARWRATVVLTHNGWPVPAPGAAIGARPATGARNQWSATRETKDERRSTEGEIRPSSFVLGPLQPQRHRLAADAAVEPTGDIVAIVGAALEERVAAADRAGIARDRMVVDPGIGFGKRVAESLLLLRRLGEIKRRPGLADLPLLVGTSRKGFIGRTLGLPVTERLEGTLATLALAIAQGADLVRVHDVRAAVRCCRMADAIVREP